jgi:FAD/FMN-containing dehydrogenase/Fe-S oxidoreductase
MDQLDQQRERLQADLRGLVAGEVRCDANFLQLYASDASVYEIKPLAVVCPRSAADVAACLQYANQKQIPVHARGAGSGVAGESLGPGIVVDFSKYLRRIVRSDSNTVRVQAGVVHERLNTYLRAQGRIFAPDPATSAVTTIGGMIGIDASGSRRLKYGSTRQHVVSLQVVLADGRILEIGREPITMAGVDHRPPRKRELILRVADVLSRGDALVQQYQANRQHSRCGYDLSDVLRDGHLNLVQLLAGSEGTLGLVTEATLRTEELPRHRGVVLLFFDSLDRASRTVLEVVEHQPSACDLMDRRHVSLVREAEPRFETLIPREAEAVLLVEYEASDPLEVRDRLHRLVDQIWHQSHRAFGARQAFEPSETELFWQLADRCQPAYYRLKGPTRPIPVAEDMSVPPEVLPEFFVRLQNVFKKHEITASVFAHAATGQVHIRPFLDLISDDDVRKMRELTNDLYQQVFEVHGGIGGENACGLSRTPFLRQQYGDLYDVFRQIKQVFDPTNILNPGKIVGTDPDLLVRNLRPAITPPPASPESTATDNGELGLRDLVELQLNWDPSVVVEAATQCTGCGDCRSQSADVRMCPIFRIAPSEEASPRAKANLIRGILTGSLELSTLTSDAFKEIADLCVHCHMCRLECPAAVDIPRLMRESKGAYVAANGLSPAQWAMTRLDLVAGVASLVSPVANWALGNRQMRWLLEKILGVAQGRKLPRVASRSFLRRSAKRRLSRPSRRSGQKVVYFVDHYANYHDPQLAEALVAVLEHNGVEVYVHPEQRQAGMAAIACGALDYARKLAQHNVAVLSEAVRQGYHVVATEPAAVLCLTREYPQLIDDDEVRLVAARSSEACDYLWRMHTLGKLQLDLHPVNIALAHHMPCHLKALQVGTPGRNLLSLIPGLRLHPIEDGCSGMAGTFGLLRQNYRASLRAGRGLISRLRDPAVVAGSTECSACKIQMEQGTAKPTIHPIKILALAYGLMPEIAPLLTRPGEPLIVS